jgi:UDP-N-acetyl-D-galactosamine dehydrogenase
MDTSRIAVIGLGYVGLPLAIELSKKYAVLGYDINQSRIDELKRGEDHTKEAEPEELSLSIDRGIVFSSDRTELENASVYIVTVPTPIDGNNTPDLRPLISASKMIGASMKKEAVVIYESTTYPGCTEEDCVPVLERESELVFNKDFFCGYSPERINPGDRINTLTKIKKVTSGSTPEAARFIDDLYKSIIEAGTHLAPSIKVAEASKAIENAQRDLNISFVNELALIFDRVGIDTNDVLEAAATKWNFLRYSPGLVGGHCISVDPYYLSHKAEQLGYHPAVILSGRRVNNAMPLFVANKIVKLLIDKGNPIKGSRALILGVTFKENCPDIRNSKVAQIAKELTGFGIETDVHDPWAHPEQVKKEFGLTLNGAWPKPEYYDAILLAVAHREFLSIDVRKLLRNQSAGIVYDIKSVLNRDAVDGRL